MAIPFKEGVASALEERMAFLRNIGRPINVQPVPSKGATRKSAPVIKTPTLASEPTPFDTVLKTVGGYYGINQREIMGDDRKAKIAHARQVAMYLLWKVLQLPLAEIGRRLNRDHTTVMHGCEKIIEERGTDTKLNEELQQLEQVLAPLQKEPPTKKEVVPKPTAKKAVPPPAPTPPVEVPNSVTLFQTAIKFVAVFYGITENELLSKARPVMVALTVIKARQILMYLLWKALELPYAEIARLLGRDVPTVMRSCEKVNKQQSTDTELLGELVRLEQLLRGAKLGSAITPEKKKILVVAAPPATPTAVDPPRVKPARKRERNPTVERLELEKPALENELEQLLRQFTLKIVDLLGRHMSADLSVQKSRAPRRTGRGKTNSLKERR